MARVDVDRLRDDRWERLRDLVPGGRAGQRGPWCDSRLFVGALLWMARSGARWRDLPERYGDDQAVKRRFYRWVERDALGGFLAVLAADADLEAAGRQHGRARPPARGGGAPVKGGPDAQGLGRSRGGLSTKIHAATDALGNPVRLLFGPGQRHDVTRGHELLDGFTPDAVIADKGYDADHLRDAIRDKGAEAVIPPRSNRKTPSDYDRALYRERNLAERFFNKLKQFRRVATRYDKDLLNYRGFVQLAAVAVLLR